MIKTVYFDGDQTLWDFEVLMRRSLTATLTQLKALRPGTRTEDLDIESVVADREAVAKELRGTETNLERIRLAAFSRTLSRLGLQDDDLAAQLNAYYLEHRFDNVELFPEVADASAVLTRSYVLGLLSNGNGYPEHSGLEGMFAIGLTDTPPMPKSQTSWSSQKHSEPSRRCLRLRLQGHRPRACHRRDRAHHMRKSAFR